MRKIAKNNATKQPLSDAWLAWCGRAIGDMDFDATLLLPTHLAHQPSSDELSGALRHTLNRLDRFFLGSLHRRRKIRIPRFVTLEYAEGTGWHAHISFKLWKDRQGFVINPELFKKQLTEYWLATTNQSQRTKFSGYIVHFKPTHENFLCYSLKKVDDTPHARGLVDEANCSADTIPAA